METRARKARRGMQGHLSLRHGSYTLEVYPPAAPASRPYPSRGFKLMNTLLILGPCGSQ
jgi:hypothetical protein